MPLGVFDSGVGGLTVVRALRASFPKRDILYVGDTARVPYGNKSAETVTAYSREIIAFLKAKGADRIVVACNTASALAVFAEGDFAALVDRALAAANARAFELG